MESIPPVPPVPPGFRGQGFLPVDRLERISRERDRPEQRRREPRREQPPATDEQSEPGEDDGLPHIDVHA